MNLTKRLKILLTALPVLVIVCAVETFGSSIWPGTAVPAVVDFGSTRAAELGVKFRSDTKGSITGIRFYKAGANTGIHVANLWSSTGKRLATATFSQETSSGWQQVNFSTPVAISANTVYVASYHTNTGHYSDDQNFFAGKGVDNPPLHALADGVSGANGVYAYSSTSSFPKKGWNASNYWVDVVFTPADTTPPVVTAFSVPATAATLTVPITSITATDNVAVTGYLVNESATAPAASASGWTSTTPATYTFATAGSKTLYAWAKDAAGNVSTSMSATITVTFSDTLPPTITAFSVPATSTMLTVPITSFTATDNVAVTGYLVNESATAPAASVGGWTSTAPATYTFATAGSKILYAWARDAAGNVSASMSSAVTVTLSANMPILIVSSSSNPFSSYYAEILRTEGFNAFDVSDISSITSTVLASYDVVILGQISLTDSQVTMLSNWVNSGGHLIAMRPDKKLSGLLGLTDLASTISDSYLLIDTSSGPGMGLVNATIQYHGTADRYALNGASSLATLYSNATTSTSSPALSLKQVGTMGGQAAAFAYDLARSVVYTRQGNPAWSGEERDGYAPIRSDDLYFGAASFDHQPDWVDLGKVTIPQADEQQRLLANLIIRMNQDKRPLPRFWYFPRNLAAVVVMTGDDHGALYSGGATAARFDQFLAASPAGCVVDNWECVRGSAYVFPPVAASNPLTNSQAATYIQKGFEIGVHVDSNPTCTDWTPSSLETAYTSYLSSFASKYTSVPAPRTHRMHCISWSDYDSQPRTELRHGIRLDTSYYYWPDSWINNIPGLLTGSGMPMRFADINGAILDIYQAPTQMTDESGQSYPYTIDTLLGNATGPAGYYGAFVANMHNDTAQSPGADAIVLSAQAHGVPVITAGQLLAWLDGRNASNFSSPAWNGATLGFSISVGQGANGLVAMVPIPNGQTVTSITNNGSSISFTIAKIKGIDYARFPAANGAFQVNYGIDTSPPTISAVSPANGATGVSVTSQVTITFSEAMDPATVSTSTIELRDPVNSPVPATVIYDGVEQTATLAPVSLLANSASYTVIILGGTSGVKDLSGTPMANDFISSFTTAATSAGSYSIWPGATVPGVVDSGPDSAVELGVKFRSDTAGNITGIRFYKASTNTGAHVGNLWSSTGTRLATATFTGETASGWQQVNFSTPVAITASTVYVASYHTNVGHYSYGLNYFTNSGVDTPPLHALANGVSGFNGVFAYGSSSSFPNQGWNSSNYWVDVVFTPGDSTPPVVTAFNLPATATTLTVPITSFTATDNVAVTGYLVNESATAPAASASGWTSTAPATYTFATAGSKTLYAWAKDVAENVSASKNAAVTVTLSDTQPPAITAFSVPATATTLTVPITTFTATDNVAVTGYLVNESATAPTASASGWTSTAPATYTFATAGSKTLYAWAKDVAGNVSASMSATVTITLQTTGVEPAGWYAGDMHVHRSCGEVPDTVSNMLQRMAPQDLAVISLLADMGNGEVQDPVTDLPLVNGQDASISTSGRILHWDTEWHWDPIYYQYPHQALGGHIVALGLSQAQQVWQESTYQIFDWAHQRGGIAGFAHMQYLDNNIPQTLTCCTPIEYPVEVALGTSDFISEDVSDAGSTCGGGGQSTLYPENAVKAYYRLLNCGFRPGFAAGTDYPCNCNHDLGTLLTYVQVAGGQMTYRNWIEGIAAGRTVVSRNGHNEFIGLTVNGSATPGDEIKLTNAGSVQVNIQWTANQNYSGTIELVRNGAVVASTQASVSSGVPASLTATVNFERSGWLAARRMDSSMGHMAHTAAVFVTVNNAPVRASVADAQFYVQWMDNLLTKTSPGGAWNSYFPTNLTQAQARYQSAKALYQQIAAEAAQQLTITTVALPDGALNTSYAATLEAGGGTTPYTWSIVSGSLPNGLSLNSGTGAISGTPTATGTFNFTVQVSDSANPIKTTTKTLSITVTAQAIFSIWPAATVPGVVDSGPDSAVELGVKFRSDTSGSITGIRFYKASTNTGAHVGNLWTSSGALLATAIFTNETTSGWQQINFSTPVAIAANTVYVASYHTNAGHYSDDQNYFAGKGVDSPPLHALADGVSGFNGVYAYGSASSFPNQGWNTSNYWVDVVFQP